MNRIIFVTGNANKLKEVETILKPSFSALQITSLSLDLPEIQNDDPEEIVKEKCKAAVQITSQPTLVEDTCLGFNAYGGLPGPFIKWFLKKLGPEGLHKMLSGFEDKSAEAQCYFAFSTGKPEDEIVVFKGITPGTIVQPRGRSGFGWDSCFQPDGFDSTYAEMSKDLKNSISHRGRALEKLKQYFSECNKTTP